ncbi:hypothetical protein D3Z39_15610, partial [Anaerotruncus colihominis]|nr:hypothetical protein [Anaerotruncus colihominis]
QKAAGETAAKAPCGFWPPSRAEPLSPGRSPHKKRGPQAARACSDEPPAPSKIRDRRRAAGMDFASTRFPAFLKKGFGEKLSSVAPRTVGWAQFNNSPPDVLACAWYDRARQRWG